MVSLFSTRRYPAGREYKRDDQPIPSGEQRLFYQSELRGGAHEC
jgi:hypothetical protein